MRGCVRPRWMSSTTAADRDVSALTLGFLKFLVECAFGLSGLIGCVDVAVKLWACIFFQGCENIKNVDVQRCPGGASQAETSWPGRNRSLAVGGKSETRAAKAKSAGDVEFFQLWTVRKASLFLMDACGRRNAALYNSGQQVCHGRPVGVPQNMFEKRREFLLLE